MCPWRDLQSEAASKPCIAVRQFHDEAPCHVSVPEVEASAEAKGGRVHAAQPNPLGPVFLAPHQPFPACAGGGNWTRCTSHERSSQQRRPPLWQPGASTTHASANSRAHTHTAVHLLCSPARFPPCPPLFTAATYPPQTLARQTRQPLVHPDNPR